MASRGKIESNDCDREEPRKILATLKKCGMTGKKKNFIIIKGVILIPADWAGTGGKYVSREGRSLKTEPFSEDKNTSKGWNPVQSADGGSKNRKIKKGLLKGGKKPFHA